ncbi:MAG: hypothetical protein A2231_11285 [Candidatus Firestonebacteria bacterium RIFOXYA2_FULL_40_8]|nr:MAG: hypothetical protein A2231_11285 [Candidatus Firestonebacteria bacterium RIFOXYA2_FULL_40_8]
MRKSIFFVAAVLMLGLTSLVFSAVPALTYSTYLGTSSEDRVNAMHVDGAGNVYLTGQTAGILFPGAATSTIQTTNYGGAFDVFVMKINAAGTLAWSTYIGGDAIDIAHAIAVGVNGDVFIAGETTSASATLPMIAPYDNTYNGGIDTFVTAISAAGGGIIYSTYIGCPGIDIGYGIAVDNLGAAYVTGVTTPSGTGFPETTTVDPRGRGASDVFVCKFTPAGGLAYSTLVGSTGIDIGRAITIDSDKNAYITGQTSGTFVDAALFPSVFNSSSTGATDAFVCKISADFATLLYTTYMGGNGNEDAYGIALDGSNRVYITGFTDSTTNFPKTGVAMAGQIVKGTGEDAFVVKLNLGFAGSSDCMYATYLGGDGADRATAIKVDTAGNAYVAGYTASTATGFPLKDAIYATRTGATMAFVAEIGPAPVPGELPVFCSYLGGTDGATDQEGWGIGLDTTRNIYVSGWTSSTLFPTAGSGAMPLYNANAGASGTYDGFVSKISAPSPLSATLPAITSLNPIAGLPAGGTVVTINGTDLTGATAVKFGTTNATSFTVVSNVKIIAIAPAHAAGRVDVVVTTAAGNSPSPVVEDRYTYYVASDITTSGDCEPFIFPSPTTGSTAALAYCMTGPGLAKVTIYNEVGKLVYTLEEGKAVGPQSSRIEVGNLAPGVYFYVLSMNYYDGTTARLAKRKFAVIH